MAGKKKQKRTVVHVKATYDAASTTLNNIEQWKFVDSLSANDANSKEVRHTLSTRSRYEAANNSYLSGMLGTIAQDTIGTGPRIQFREEGTTLDDLKKDWIKWGRETGLASNLRIMRETKGRDGEAFGLKVSNRRLKNRVKLDLQLIETELVGSHFRSNAQVDGVWLDSLGRPEFFNILDNHPQSTTLTTGGGTKTRSEKVIHYPYVTRPQQIRGIPETTPSLGLFVQLRAYTLSVLAASETAANISALLHTDGAAEDPVDDMPPFESFNMERNTMKALPFGWKMTQFKAEQPTNTYKDFKTELLSEIARAMQIPFNVAAGNSSGYNFASGRLDFQRYFKSITVERSEIERIILDDLFDDYAREWFLVKGIEPTDTEHFWMWDGHEHIDPVKSANGQNIRLGSKVTNLAVESAREGFDWQVILKQRLIEEQTEIKMREEMGLPPMQEPTTNNQDEDDEEERD